MRSPRMVLKYFAAAVCAVGLGAAGVFVLPWLNKRLAAAEEGPAPQSVSPAELVPGASAALRLPRDVPGSLGIRTAEVQSAGEAMTLELPGTLILDSNRLSHVHARFPGEVVQIGDDAKADQRVDVGEPVRQGQLLAVLWCQDLGEKKSELVDTLSQLRVDQETYDHMLKSSTEGALPDRSLREAKRRVETDRIARDRVVRTLQSWRVTKEEIAAVEAEAGRQAQSGASPRPETVHEWAKLEIRSPLDGVLLERNVVKGDLVDTSLDLFKIADLSHLRVVAYAYEEDLPALDALPHDQRRWSVHVGAEEGPALGGRFDRIGRIIDPNQHTALVMGWVNNSGNQYRVGQFVTATVELLPMKDEVAIPATAMVDEGSRQVVFVQPKAGEPQYVERAIAVSRRTPSTVFVRNKLTRADRQRGLMPLVIGERVVVSGAVQLEDALKKLQGSLAAR